MNDRSFDAAAAGSAGAANRRITLAALGAVALSAMGAAAPARAGKNGSKARKRRRKQRGPCLTFIRQECGYDETCVAARTRCCGLLANCRFTAFVQCFDEAPQNGDRRAPARGPGLLG